jgi:RNA recognition motif-containing protein
MSQTLYVGGLSYSTTEESLKNYFATAGEVVSAQVISDRFSGRSRGFGFVEMASDEDANSAIEKFNGQEFEGRKLNVNIARPKSDQPRGNNSNFRDGGHRERRSY